MNTEATTAEESISTGESIMTGDRAKAPTVEETTDREEGTEDMREEKTMTGDRARITTSPNKLACTNDEN